MLLLDMLHDLDMCVKAFGAFLMGTVIRAIGRARLEALTKALLLALQTES